MTKASFKCNLIQILQKAINLYQEQLELSCRYENTLEVWQKKEEIPINQTINNGAIVYKSAIAMKLASVCQQPAIYIATELVKYCREIVNTDTNKETDNFEFEVISSGIIYFYLTDLSIANWLDYLTSFPLNFEQQELQVGVDFNEVRSCFCNGDVSKSPKTFRQSRRGFRPNYFDKSLETTNLFPIQYSHARCCSLLRMGIRDRLINVTLTGPDGSGQFWQLQTSKSISWQQPNGQLQFLHDAEYQLIAQIASTLDRIYCVSSSKKPINWQKVADAMSVAFQDFYSHCRIWGEVKVKKPKLAQARLGLVLVSQSILRFLLEERLGGEAPVEL
ncbi:DALR anticodon-binding domain-containing protein [Okeania sp. SIO2C2]|uniref:DALR anticodon-binding domain-containing protein n=1 Tax=Okeania sp. SIO2C2 TaxID=2607787 RepID=UPI00257F1D86|nr:DALR anticodon-binding domain-containing protein [Okeania sp. SIO2C2]